MSLKIGLRCTQDVQARPRLAAVALFGYGFFRRSLMEAVRVFLGEELLWEAIVRRTTATGIERAQSFRGAAEVLPSVRIHSRILAEIVMPSVSTTISRAVASKPLPATI